MFWDEIIRDVGFLNRCIELASRSPESLCYRCGAIVASCQFNPDWWAIGVGYTQFEDGYFGDGRRKLCHAERAALRSVVLEAFDLDKIILYCSLEPCHSLTNDSDGRSCAEFILESGIKKVRFAHWDPNPDINGFEFLNKNGVAVLDYSCYYKRAPRWMAPFNRVDVRKIAGNGHMPRDRFKMEVKKAALKKHLRIFLPGKD